MTQIVVSAEAVVALGQTLSDVADTLEALALASGDDAAYGPGSVGGAVSQLVGDWELARRRLCDALRAAAGAARSAGEVYLETESCVARSFAPAPATP